MGSRGRIPDPFGVREERRKRKNLRAVPPGAKAQKQMRRSFVKMPEEVASKPYSSEFWQAHSRVLQEIGRLDPRSKLVFARLCMVYQRIREYTEIIDREGATVTGPRGGTFKHPLLTALAQAERNFIDLCAKFGLEPAADARVPKRPTQQPTEDSKFFGGAPNKLQKYMNPWSQLK
jgi:P27 family predicted phage terminase small subunit